jgi:hypothetical protein
MKENVKDIDVFLILSQENRVVVSLDVCSNAFAALTPILENSFTLSLAV